MAKIINKATGEIIAQNDDLYGISLVEEFFEQEENDFWVHKFERLSELVKTMTGDAATEFNTVGEMIEAIPEILTCDEECHFLLVDNYDKRKWFVLGWNYEGDTKTSNMVLHEFFPDYDVTED